jgi:hypothetical protein
MDPRDVQERVRGGCIGAPRGETSQEIGAGVYVELQRGNAKNLLWSPLLPTSFVRPLLVVGSEEEWRLLFCRFGRRLSMRW